MELGHLLACQIYAKAVFMCLGVLCFDFVGAEHTLFLLYNISYNLHVRNNVTVKLLVKNISDQIDFKQEY